MSPDALTVRLEAGRLRAETQMLRLIVRRRAAYSRAQLHTAQAALSRARAKRVEPLPSPWSMLYWTYDDETLDGVLVAVP